MGMNENGKSMQNDVHTVVMGRNYCNILTMARELSKAGYEVDVLRLFDTRPRWRNITKKMRPEAYSDHISRYHSIVADNDIDSVIRCLMDMADKDKENVLVPVDDYSVGIADGNMDTLTDCYIMPGIKNKAGEIVRLMDKSIQKKLASEAGFNVPYGVVIRSKDGKYDIPEGIKYPCFVKPVKSITGKKSTMKKIDNKDELDTELMRLVEKDDFELLVEEFVDIKNEYSVLGISDGTESVSAGIFRTIIGGNNARKGVAATGEIVSIERHEELLDRCNEFMRTFEYTGLFDIDLMETSDGRVLFAEVNFRAGASTYILEASEVNLPKVMVDHMVYGVPLERPVGSGISSGSRFVSEKVLLEEYIRGDIGCFEAKKAFSEADLFFIKDSSDPGPYRNFRKYYVIAALMRLLYKARTLKK